MTTREPLSLGLSYFLMRFLYCALLCATRVALAQVEPVPLDFKVDGVYSMYGNEWYNERVPEERRQGTTYMGTEILELKDGRFRYWFFSDYKTAYEPKYPVTGTYTAKADAGTIAITIKIGSPPREDGRPPRDIYYPRNGDES